MSCPHALSGPPIWPKPRVCPHYQQQVDILALILGRLGFPALGVELCGPGGHMRCLGRGSHQAAVGSQGRICATLPCRGMRASVSCTMVCSQGWPRGGGRGVLFTTACQASSSSAAGVELAQRAPHSERNRWLCCLISALTGAGTGARARSGTERETRPVPLLAWPTSSQGS